MREARHDVTIPVSAGKRGRLRWLIAIDATLTRPVPCFRQTMVAVFR